MSRPAIFISYSHKDEHWKNRLVRHLKVLELEDELAVWHDRKIAAGDDWLAAIREALAGARVAVLLITADFLTSDFIRREEVPALLERRRSEGVRVIPLLVMPCPWQAVPWLTALQMRPTDARPLAAGKAHEIEADLAALTLEIRDLLGIGGQETVEDLASRTASPGRLVGVPKLPPCYVERPEYLEPLKRAVLHPAADKLGITGSGTVGVQGMGGIGKTVLATALARDEDVRVTFPDGVLWVTVGQQPDLVALQGELARGAGHPGPVLASVHEGKRGLQRLFEGRRTLLVVDDVWTAEAAAAFDVVSGEGRLVVTTRNRDVMVGLGAKEHQLDVLEPEQARSFLALWTEREAGDLPEVADRVAAACGYLPLALAMIGAMVRLRPTAWDDALTLLERADLEKFRRAFPDYPYPNLLRALEVSVEALEPEERDRYLELAVFPEDAAVPEAAVVTLWSGAGMEGVDAREFAGKLVARSLASREEDGRLKLHDLQVDYVRHWAGDLSELHGRLVDAYAARCPAGWASGPDDGYYFEQLPKHLADAGRAEELRALLLDFSWLQAKLETVGATALIADYDLLPGQDMRLVQGALRLASHALVQYPQQLAGQLLGRLRADLEVAGIDDLLKGARTAGPGHATSFSSRRISLLPRSATLTPPGGPLVRILEGHSGPVTALAVLADGRLVSGSEDGTLRVWDLATCSTFIILETHDAGVDAVVALADGRVVSGLDDRTLEVWDPAGGAPPAILEGHGGRVRAMAALADGRVVSGSAADPRLWVWEPASGTAPVILEGHASGVESVVALADGRIVSGSTDCTLRVWDPAGGAALVILESQNGWVTALAELDGRRVVSGSDDGTLQIWDPSCGVALSILEGGGGSVEALAALADGRVVSGSDDGTLRVWDPAGGEELVTIESHSGGIGALAALADGRVVSGSDDGTLRVWDPAGDAPLDALEIHGDSVTALAALADGGVVSSSFEDGTLQVWDPATGALLATFEGHGHRVMALAVLADGRVVSGSADGSLRVVDPATGKVLAAFKGHGSAVTVLAALADGRIVSGSDDRTLRVWDPAGGPQLAALRGHFSGITALAAFADGRVVSGSWDYTLRVWNPAGGEELATFACRYGPVFALAVLADGRIVSGSHGGTLPVWDPADGEAHAVLEGHAGEVTALAALADGRVVSGSDDRTLRVWDVKSRKLQAVFTLDAPAWAAVESNGIVTVGDSSGRVHFFDVVEARDGGRISN